MGKNRFGGGVLEVRRFEAVVGGHKVAAGVQPRCGANLVSLQVDGQEYLYYDEKLLVGPDEMFTGCFIMFPTPCRIPEGRYEFGGRRITQVKGGKLVTIHGLVRDEEFQAELKGNEMRCTLDITPDHPVHEGFPFPGRLSVAMKLVERGLQYSFRFENRGKSPAPVGFGLHPFWRVPGDRKDVYVRVPCERTLLMEKLIPTGEAEPVAGTRLDLRQPRCLADLDVDNVFIDRIGDEPAVVEYRDLGKRVTLWADKVFSHQICYAPPGRPFVCVENLTCAPNAVNLQSAPSEVSGFRVVQPGQSLAGTTRFIVEDL